MNVKDALQGVSKLGLDAAPLVYFVEKHPAFSPLCHPFFAAIGSRQIQAVVSSLVYAEILVKPIRDSDLPLISLYRNLLEATQGVVTFPVSTLLAEQAAELRARYKLRTPDAVQIATAIDSGCEAFLTNDKDLRRVVEIRVIVLSELIL